MSVPDEDLPEVPELALGTYEHYKGKQYEVVSVGLHSESLEPLVVYKPLYPTKIAVWVRPYAMFIESVQIDGENVPRFKKL